ncbi:hypothetical protein EPUS_07461 [Endocarpon pusillum Z07020]|uniref:BTB domain-containing protein n=1 Tax=Endocarpon pusillum (strain Z07020 / HMAS-L-300199) TaxID=1263415 RepID=U1GJH9_ENDPU|nr:uncharacterized protein EPUS_07461 [Endocarpon pusillum Z07020]ERF71991.1 hypothetical protein EPUS_07461 [Endocarpon pusillum Z07020]
MAGWPQSRMLQGIVEDVVARFRRPTILCQTYGREKAKVHMGHARICYVVPKKLLYEKSSYFRSVFTGGFEEANASGPELPHIEAETFEPVVKWMMSGIIEVPKKRLGDVCSSIDDDEQGEAAAGVFRQALVVEEWMDSHTETESYLATVWVTCIILPMSNNNKSLISVQCTSLQNEID